MNDDEQQQGSKTRRAVLAAGAAVTAGGLVVAGGGKAQAANGDPVVLGQSNSSSAVTTVNNSADAVGFRVNCTGTGAAANALMGTGRNAYGIVAYSTDHNGGKIYTQDAARFGIWAENSAATSGAGVALYAIHKATGSGASGATAVRGLQGTGAQSIIDTVRGQRWPAAGEFAGASGVIGASAQTGGTGVVGYATTGTGVWAGTGTAEENALVAAGNATVTGNLDVQGMLTKAGGAFRIDHPLDPANRYLSHSFVESPDMMNVYNGVTEADTSGTAVVALPEWFETLNRDFRYQLTPLGAPAPELHVSAEVTGNQFTIAGAQPGQRVSWQITGIRHDAWAEDNRIPVDHPKPEAERGTYLYPQGFDRPSSENVSAPQLIQPTPHG